MKSSQNRLDGPEIVLDLSRLLSRVDHPTPTGVDRCEMAYARGLLAAAPDRLRFGAVHPLGHYGRLPPGAVQRFLDLTEERWGSRGFSSRWDKLRFVTSTLVSLLPRQKPPASSRRRVYIQASPNNLTRPKKIQQILALEQAKYICLVHDLIPLEFPEYGRANGAEKHFKRVKTIVDHADGIVANSHATMASLGPWIAASGRAPKCAVSHLGTPMPSDAPIDRPGDERPYFVCIGTIEPRKNHLLLLNIWRRLNEEMDRRDVPRLIIIGRRGWENEQVVDMLERCVALKGSVEEYNLLPDNRAAALLRGARALLLPSFAEGYGMPVTEALNLKVPVICSDLPALREAGGHVPDFIDPIDGPGWAAAIFDYALPLSGRRANQLSRMATWRPPTWDDHLKTVLSLGEAIQ